MRQILSVVFLLSVVFGFGQTYEAGIFLGGANVVGDVGSTSYIAPTDLAFGGIFKWNKSKRYAWRGTLIYANVTADDTKSSSTARQERAFVVDNRIFEASAGLEVNFTEYNLHKLGPAFTPYLYTGITYFRYDFNYFNGNDFQDISQKDGAFSIPMTLGLKYRLNQYLILGGEVGARYTFTDNLDASNPRNSNFEEFRFGNIFSDDWYIFSGFTLTYTFGRKLCTDCFE